MPSQIKAVQPSELNPSIIKGLAHFIYEHSTGKLLSGKYYQILSLKHDAYIVVENWQLPNSVNRECELISKGVNSDDAINRLKSSPTPKDQKKDGRVWKNVDWDGSYYGYQIRITDLYDDWVMIQSIHDLNIDSTSSPLEADMKKWYTPKN